MNSYRRARSGFQRGRCCPRPRFCVCPAPSPCVQRNFAHLCTLSYYLCIFLSSFPSRLALISRIEDILPETSVELRVLSWAPLHRFRIGRRVGSGVSAAVGANGLTTLTGMHRQMRHLLLKSHKRLPNPPDVIPSTRLLALFWSTPTGG